jgi:hypothetical protein
MREILMLCLMVLAGLLSACDDSNKPVENTGKYAPILNPHPKYFFKAYGTLAPGIKKSIKLSFVLDYSTEKKECLVSVNKLAGVYSVRNEITKYTIKPDKNGYYQLKIPLDKYEPGYCNWSWGSIHYVIVGSRHKIQPIQILRFKKGVDKSSVKKGYSVWECESGKKCREVSVKFIQNNLNDINSMESDYQYKLDIKDASTWD